MLFSILFIHSYKTTFLSYSITVDSSNIGIQSKASTFKWVKRFLCKHCPRFSKIGRVGKHLNQILMLLYDCMPILSHLLSIGNLLKNSVPLEMGKNPATRLYSSTTKREKIFYEKKTIKV